MEVAVGSIPSSTATSTFAGFYNPCLGARVWLSNTEIVLPADLRSTGSIVLVSLRVGSQARLTRLEPPVCEFPSELRLCDVSAADRTILAVHSSPLDSPRLVCAKIDIGVGAQGLESTQSSSGSSSTVPVWRDLPIDVVSAELRGNATTEVIQIVPTDAVASDAAQGFEAIYTSPLSAAPPPLVVMPHGGPHSSFHTGFNTAIAFLTAAGFATLQARFRGCAAIPLLADEPARLHRAPRFVPSRFQSAPQRRRSTTAARSGSGRSR